MFIPRRQKALDMVDKRTRELEVARVKNRDIIGAERKLEVKRTTSQFLDRI